MGTTTRVQTWRMLGGSRVRLPEPLVTSLHLQCTGSLKLEVYSRLVLEQVIICDVAFLNSSAAASGIGGAFPSIALGASGRRLPGPVCVGHAQQVGFRRLAHLRSENRRYEPLGRCAEYSLRHPFAYKCYLLCQMHD